MTQDNVYLGRMIQEAPSAEHSTEHIGEKDAALLQTVGADGMGYILADMPLHAHTGSLQRPCRLKHCRERHHIVLVAVEEQYRRL